MKKTLTHDRGAETIEAKTRWFRSLSIDERAEILNEFTELALTVNPKILVKKNAQPVKGRVCVLSKA
ncbi:MAG: hypothetical protein KJ606_10740 [Chloroflexi bacterium]|nr:hypothetical protein [Chloroflexota bacterium]